MRASECAYEKTWYHYASDEQGSIVFITDEEEIKNRYEYDAFGNAVICEEKVENRYRYTGQQYDQVTQQYYLRARYYNPVIARFTQEDVYRGDGLNLYAYCANNPVMYYDPSGYVCDEKYNLYRQYREQGMSAQEAQRRASLDMAGGDAAEAARRREARIANQRANQPPKPRANKPNASADQKKEHGGYRVNDTDRYGNMSPDTHRAQGNSYRSSDRNVQAHHPVQNEWAKRNVPEYNEYDAPSILLPSSSGTEHARISSAQRARRRQESTRFGDTTLRDEMNIGYSEMINAGVDRKAAQKVMRKAYKYFYSIGAF